MNTPAPSPHLTHDQMHAVLTDWHAQCVDDPLYAHLDISFEDMADKLWRAMRLLKADQEMAAWAQREDMPGFAGTYARLGALNLQQVAA